MENLIFTKNLSEKDLEQIIKICRYFANRFGKTPDEKEELYSVAITEAMKYVENFNDKLGKELPKFLFKRILGSITDASKGRNEVAFTFNIETNVFEKVDDRLFVDYALSVLNEREREVVFRYYFEGKTLLEIAKEAGLSRDVIFKIKRKALNKMKDFLCQSETKKL